MSYNCGKCTTRVSPALFQCLYCSIYLCDAHSAAHPWEEKDARIQRLITTSSSSSSSSSTLVTTTSCETEYEDPAGVMNTFLEHLDTSHADRKKSDTERIVPLVPLINASMTGKTRLMRESCRYRFGSLLILRSPDDHDTRGSILPPATYGADNLYMTTCSEHFYDIFIRVLLATFTEWMTRQKVAVSSETNLYEMWYHHQQTKEFWKTI